MRPSSGQAKVSTIFGEAAHAVSVAASDQKVAILERAVDAATNLDLVDQVADVGTVLGGGAAFVPELLGDAQREPLPFLRVHSVHDLVFGPGSKTLPTKDERPGEVNRRGVRGSKPS